MAIIQPGPLAVPFKENIINEISDNNYKITIVGFLCNDDPAALKYANYTRSACDEVGINFDLRVIPRLELEDAILLANDDCDIHGIFIYYPIFNVEQDAYLKNLVSPYKDVEGLGQYWTSKLYKDIRYDDTQKTKKTVLPCTPLAIVKILDGLNFDTNGKTIAIFNRSEVVGRPLASMLAHDGAKVISFDEHGPLVFEKSMTKECHLTRDQALKESDLVITGVPSRHFDLIKMSELSSDKIGLNFSTLQNFEKECYEGLKTFVPRVGPLTVTMCLRNALRLFKNYHCNG
jgi:methylenetetrahydrofolate dehydrogenase (NADP+)/methenyltetrahydrofolate cyclohydrolase